MPVDSQHWENFFSISFQIEWDMFVVTVFLSILHQMEFHLVQNQKENCHPDHIPFNLKGNGKKFSQSMWNFAVRNSCMYILGRHKSGMQKFCNSFQANKNYTKNDTSNHVESLDDWWEDRTSPLDE